jgi:hypothetical protein
MLDTPLTLSQIILFGFFAYIGYNIYNTLVEFNNRVKKIAEFTESINRLMQLQVPHNLNNNIHNMNNNDNQNWWSVVSSYLAHNPDLSNNLINVYVNAIRGWVNLFRNYFHNNTEEETFVPNTHVDQPMFGLNENARTLFGKNSRNFRNIRKTNLYKNYSVDVPTPCPLYPKSLNVKKCESVLNDLIVESDTEQHSDVSDNESICSLRINDSSTAKYKKNGNEFKCEEPIHVNI